MILKLVIANADETRGSKADLLYNLYQLSTLSRYQTIYLK